VLADWTLGDEHTTLTVEQCRGHDSQPRFIQDCPHLL
jgi:hypothetical protein